MNHYAKIAGAVCVGILGAKFVEACGKTVAGVFTKAAAKVAGLNNEAEDAPSAEAPKPEKKAPEKKDGQGKKDDKKTGKDDKKSDAEAE